MVLYDAVVDNGDLPGAVRVGMGVPAAGLPVGGPSGMGNPEHALHLIKIKGRIDIIDHPRFLLQVDPSVHHGNPDGVIPPVFEPLYSID